MPQQYLSRYAQPEAALAQHLTGDYAAVLAVPACDEQADDLLALAVDCEVQRLLTVVVVNGAAHHPARVHQQNQRLLTELTTRTAARRLTAAAWLGEHGAGDWLIIDRASEGLRFGKRQGVGMARRIGADVACALWHACRVASGLIHMSDADARLPVDYFSVTAAVGVAAWVYPFRHLPGAEPAMSRAHAIYELYLRYYVLGLRYAGSGYAFHTIGSTIAVDALAYAKVRGMPKRQAAEDFYLLNKLAKVGAVRTPAVGPVRLLARHSARVPFGTGRATASIVAADQQWPLYHPDIFRALAVLLTSLQAAVSAAPPSAAADEIGQAGRTSASPAVEQRLAMALDEAAAALPAAMAAALRTAWASLDTTGLVRALEGAPLRQWAARLGDWLDAFRTRKLVHALRAAGLGSLPWWQALSQAPFCNVRLTADSDAAVLWSACRTLAAAEGGAAS